MLTKVEYFAGRLRSGGLEEKDPARCFDIEVEIDSRGRLGSLQEP